MKVVRAFARTFHLEVTDKDRTERYMRLEGTVKQVEKALGITLVKKTVDGETFLFHREAIRLPAEIERITESVSGIQNPPVLSEKIFPNTLRPEDSAEGEAALPHDFEEWYKFPKNLDGSGECLGIIALGGGYDKDFLPKYFKRLGLKMPDIRWVGVQDAKNSPELNFKADCEVYMDIEIVGALAPGAKIVVYFAPNSSEGIIKALKKAIHDRKNKPHIISMSWGTLESNFSDHERKTLDRVLHEAMALNITVLSSSGDYGSSGKKNRKGKHSHLPTSHPMVLSVGGTQIHRKDGVILHEDTWNQTIKYGLMTFQGITGGGYSKIWAKPRYQKNYPSSRFKRSKFRGIPDVAANASTWPGILIGTPDGDQISAGTSASTPLWAALIARINEGLVKAGHHRAGFIHPYLYRGSMSEAFNPVLSGTNGAYTAGVPWNPCTGLGTPNGEILLERMLRIHQE